MATKNARINVTFDKDELEEISFLAANKNISKSKLVKELTKKALELEEEYLWSKFADSLGPVNLDNAIDEEEFWKDVLPNKV